MKKVYMNSSEHDVSVAYVSHISHITSFSLALSVLEKEEKEQNILTLAGGGFESTVRLAKSNGDTWAPIFLENSGANRLGGSTVYTLHSLRQIQEFNCFNLCPKLYHCLQF